MVAEVNPGNRANPVKQFFHNPKLHRALKITAVALAALAALAGVIALSVLIAPAFAALLIPVAFVSLVSLGVARNRSRHRRNVGPGPEVVPQVIAAQRELNEAQRENELEQARARAKAERKRQKAEKKKALRREMEGAQSAFMELPRQSYRQMINMIKDAASTFEIDVKTKQEFARTQAELLVSDIEALEELYKLEAKTGNPYDFASLDRETELAVSLSKIYKLTQAHMEGSSETVHRAFSSLLTTVQDFATKHHLDLDSAAVPSEDSKVASAQATKDESHPVETASAEPVINPTPDELSWQQEYNDLLTGFINAYRQLPPVVDGSLPIIQGARFINETREYLEKISAYMDAHVQNEFSAVTLHADFLESLKLLVKESTDLVDQHDAGENEIGAFFGWLNSVAIKMLAKCPGDQEMLSSSSSSVHSEKEVEDLQLAVNHTTLEKDIHKAAMKGNVEAIEALCTQGVSVNLRDDRGDTPLNLAVTKLLNRELSTKNDLKDVQEIREVLTGKVRFAIPLENLTEQDRLKDSINMLLSLGADPLMQNFARICPLTMCYQWIDKLEASHEATNAEKKSSWPVRKNQI
jgi:hypothetical protein